MGISNRGFASMSPEKRREIASRGGKATSPEARAFAKNPELASRAGKVGGKAIPAEARSYSKDRTLASEAGKKGGAIAGAARRAAAIAQAQAAQDAGSN